MQRWTPACVLALLLLVPATNAQADDYAWPTHDEVAAALDGAATSDWVMLETVGQSVQGKDLRMAVVTDPASPIPMEERVVTLILTQQHGNEPAGTPAALALLDDIVAGMDVAATLQNQILLLWPMANPDGGEAHQRANDAGTDLNRDHIHLEEPETRALHAIFNAWDVHVGMDHHEYGGTGTGYPNPVRTYDHDVTLLYPRHGNVRQPTLQGAQALMYDGVWPALEEKGYTVNEYGEQTVGGVPVSHIAGGPDPGILRNNFGLNNVAGLLVESFIPLAPNLFVDGERRVEVQRIVMDATLQYASQHASTLIDAKRASEQLNLEEPMVVYEESWPDDPQTGQPDDRNVEAPLAGAYHTNENLSDLLELHGLPAGVPHENGTAHDLEHPRAGLLAAMFHPDSSRKVAAATPADLLPQEEGTRLATEANEAPLPGALVLLVTLGLLVAARRR